MRNQEGEPREMTRRDVLQISGVAMAILVAFAVLGWLGWVVP